jgi:hypothetical protein
VNSAAQTGLAGLSTLFVGKQLVVFPVQENDRRVKVTSNFHKMPKLGMHGAIPPLPLLLPLEPDAQRCNKNGQNKFSTCCGTKNNQNSAVNKLRNNKLENKLTD